MIFRSRPSPFRGVAVPAAKTPEGLRIYAIGDIHGRLDLLDRLAAKVRDDLGQRGCDEVVAVFLGDYIDRGPDFVRRGGAAGDRRLSDADRRPSRQSRSATFELSRKRRRDRKLAPLRRFGDPCFLRRRRQGCDAWPGLWSRSGRRGAICPQSIGSFSNKPDFPGASATIFCHAGVRSTAPLAEQDERDLLWIREEFLAHRGPFEKIVVHGHTPAPEPKIEPNRIGIDTGAYATGALTCLVLEGQTRRFLSTREMEVQSCRAARPIGAA